MTYFQKRRAEILGKRKRRPRRCDVLRQERQRLEAQYRRLRQINAARRLERAWQ